jgi:hypothetical protein
MIERYGKGNMICELWVRELSWEGQYDSRENCLGKKYD